MPTLRGARRASASYSTTSRCPRWHPQRSKAGVPPQDGEHCLSSGSEGASRWRQFIMASTSDCFPADQTEAAGNGVCSLQFIGRPTPGHASE